MKSTIDQTFVFAPLAVKRILQDHRPLFKTVKIIDWPREGGKIVICKRSLSSIVVLATAH
jgi:hypothetical protein